MFSPPEKLRCNRRPRVNALNWAMTVDRDRGIIVHTLGRRGEAMRTAYRLKDDGYSAMKKIYFGRKLVGHVYRTDAGYRGVIGQLQAQSPTEDGAFQEVLAAHTGQPISELYRNSANFLRMKKVQAYTEIVLDFFKSRSAANGGKLTFTNTDVAMAIGKKRPDRVVGNLISRLDFACYLIGLPPLGCAAEETFKEAWKGHIGWEFPIEIMCQRAKSHRWSDSDFERIRQETQRLISKVAHLRWKEEFAKHDARVKEWAFISGAPVVPIS